MTSAPAAIERGAVLLRNVGVDFGEGSTALCAVTGIDVAIRPGEFVSILGPSGCGKSTLIGAIAGFAPVSTGEVFVDGRRVTAPGRDRGVVFQQHTLFPWKTVLQNVEFGLKVRGVGKNERSERAGALLRQVGLAEFARQYPHQLSGGMQQRVNLARVLVNEPRVLLMDEPFCSLDAQTRFSMQELLLGLWSELRMTVVFVTHDVEEAVFLSDRVLVLSRRPGKIRAEIPIYVDRPRSHEVLTSGDFIQLKRRALDALLGAADEASRSAEPWSAG